MATLFRAGIFQSGFKIASRTCSTSSWTPPDVTIDEIKNEFRGIGGGYVSLNHDQHLGIARVCFGNPYRKNAISGKMMCELHDVVMGLNNLHNCKAVIVMSDDPTFYCSGGDLDTIKAIFSHDGGYKMATLMHDLQWHLSFSDPLTVSLVRGRAIGGGAELCLATDLRVFSPDASLSFVQSRMGIATGWGGGARLSAIVGRRKALKLLVDPSKINSISASEDGLCDHVTVKNGMEAYVETEGWVRHMVSDSNPGVIHSIKRISSELEKKWLKDSLDEEKITFAKTWSHKPHKIAMDLNMKH